MPTRIPGGMQPCREEEEGLAQGCGLRESRLIPAQAQGCLSQQGTDRLPAPGTRRHPPRTAPSLRASIPRACIPLRGGAALGPSLPGTAGRSHRGGMICRARALLVHAPLRPQQGLGHKLSGPAPSWHGPTPAMSEVGIKAWDSRVGDS